MNGLSERLWYLELQNKALKKQLASFKSGNAYIKLRDEYESILREKDRKICRLENDLSKEHAERYRTELALYDRAERYLKEHLGSDTTLKLKSWKAEVATLTNEKDRLYREVRSLRTEVQEAGSVRRCVEQVQPEQQKEQTKRRGIEL